MTNFEMIPPIFRNNWTFDKLRWENFNYNFFVVLIKKAYLVQLKMIWSIIYGNLKKIKKHSGENYNTHSIISVL